MTLAVEDYTAFHQQHYDRLVQWAALKVGHHDAEDVASTAMAVVWQRWGELDDPAGYLYGTAKYSVLNEWKDRARRPATLAEMPVGLQPIHGYDADPDIAQAGTAATLAVDWVQSGGTVATAVVAATLAEGYSRQRTAELTGLPLAEVHKSVRQLRKDYRLRRGPGTAAATTVEVPVAPAMSADQLLRRLPRRQREVFTLNLLGMRPVHIAGLLGIDGGDARANLCYARKTITKSLPGTAAGKKPAETAMAGLPFGTLLELLPDSVWKHDAARLYSEPDEQLLVLSMMISAGLVRPGDIETAVAPLLQAKGQSDQAWLLSGMKGSALETCRAVTKFSGLSPDSIRAMRDLERRLPDIYDAQLARGRRPAGNDQKVREYLTAMAKVLTVVRAGCQGYSTGATHISSLRHEPGRAGRSRHGRGTSFDPSDSFIPASSGYRCPVPVWVPSHWLATIPAVEEEPEACEKLRELSLAAKVRLAVADHDVAEHLLRRRPPRTLRSPGNHVAPGHAPGGRIPAVRRPAPSVVVCRRYSLSP